MRHFVDRGGLPRRAEASSGRAIVDAVNTLLAVLVVAALLLLIVVQGVARHRRLTRRESEGQRGLPRSTWIFFGIAAAFLVFAVFFFPLIMRR